MITKQHGFPLYGALLLLFTGCYQTHVVDDGVSGGSNWLTCRALSDCPESTDAVECSGGGYCLDASGERLAARTTIESTAAIVGTPQSEVSQLFRWEDGAWVSKGLIDCTVHPKGFKPSCTTRGWPEDQSGLYIQFEKCWDAGTVSLYAYDESPMDLSRQEWAEGPVLAGEHISLEVTSVSDIRFRAEYYIEPGDTCDTIPPVVTPVDAGVLGL